MGIPNANKLYHRSWDRLMPVCKKIIESYYDYRFDIFDGLKTCDLEKTWEAVVAFIKFWNDPTQLKLIWQDQPEWAVEFIRKQGSIKPDSVLK